MEALGTSPNDQNPWTGETRSPGVDELNVWVAWNRTLTAGPTNWVAVKELNLSYHAMDIYIYICVEYTMDICRYIK